MCYTIVEVDLRSQSRLYKYWMSIARLLFRKAYIARHQNICLLKWNS